MHTGHDTGSGSQWPLYVNVDLTSKYPDGLALNQLKWGCHVNGFGTYEVQARNSPSEAWTTISTEHMNGSGSGLPEGTMHTDNWTNNMKYKYYRLKITDCNNSGGKCGWAVYSWQWNRV